MKKWYFLLLIGCSLPGRGQNLQFAPLYSASDPIQLCAEHPKFNFLYTSGGSNQVFLPDANNPNFRIEQDRDAFVMCYDKKGKYLWHVGFFGTGEQKIIGGTLNKFNSFFVLIKFGSDTAIIQTANQKYTFTDPFDGSLKDKLVLLKFGDDGELKFQKILGVWSQDCQMIIFNSYRSEDILFGVSLRKGQKIPGSTTFVSTPPFAFSHFLITLGNNDLELKALKALSSFSSQAMQVYNNVVLLEQAILVSDGSERVDSANYHKIYYLTNSSLTPEDSLTLNFGVTVNAVCHSDSSFYICFRTKNKRQPVGGNVFNDDANYLTKWKKNELTDSLKLNYSADDACFPSFFLDNKDQMYFSVGHAWQNNLGLQSVNFFKGEKHFFNKSYCHFWGPIVSDSFLWTSRLEGQTGAGSYVVHCYADENNQYMSANVSHWIDFDPGLYAFQYSPSTYGGRNVVAGYNCYPTAIFTLDQNAQRVDFYNFSAGSDSFLWDFGFATPKTHERNPVAHYPAVGDYTVTLIAYNECGADTFSFPVYIDNVVSVPEINEADVKIYPNPFNNKIQIESNLNFKTYELYSSTGKLLLSGKMEESKFIDTEFLAVGTYILRLSWDESSITRMVVKE
ncbi:MAG: T9SS type A sorting domain-containing protein [Bacteroidetes bacterium]|nr:T9SS type A sorting domain-containing protein [Bacteroidota bacterium]